MNTLKIAITTIATAILANAAIAAPAGMIKKNPEQVVANMFAHDQNSDGVLDSAELAESIEGLYDHRKQAIRERRDTLAENGILSEAEYAKGFVTMHLLPEDGAAIVMKDADINQDQTLDAQELIDSIHSLRKLDLGPRRGSARNS